MTDIPPTRANLYNCYRKNLREACNEIDCLVLMSEKGWLTILDCFCDEGLHVQDLRAQEITGMRLPRLSDDFIGIDLGSSRAPC